MKMSEFEKRYLGALQSGMGRDLARDKIQADILCEIWEMLKELTSDNCPPTSTGEK